MHSGNSFHIGHCHSCISWIDLTVVIQMLVKSFSGKEDIIKSSNFFNAYPLSSVCINSVDYHCIIDGNLKLSSSWKWKHSQSYKVKFLKIQKRKYTSGTFNNGCVHHRLVQNCLTQPKLMLASSCLVRPAQYSKHLTQSWYLPIWTTANIWPLLPLFSISSWTSLITSVVIQISWYVEQQYITSLYVSFNSTN